MNFDLLSKKAESYSSASTINTLSLPRQADLPVELETPPTKYPISLSCFKKIWHSI